MTLRKLKRAKRLRKNRQKLQEKELVEFWQKLGNQVRLERLNWN